MDWARILAYVTRMVDQELLARNEYLAAENRILKAQLDGRLKLSDAERATLGEIGHRLGRKVLAEVASVARPDTILAWYRKLVARKFDGSEALTVLPSVSSLKSLRQFATISNAAAPFIGFGNPLLTGPNADDKRAWEQQSCKNLSVLVQTTSRSVRSAIPKFFRSGLANVDEVRAQFPLPETADELCAVAQSTGAGQEAVHLGEKASEKTVEALSADGTFASARVVHFATHGLLASETEMLTASRAEPALILSPPAQATDEDDGLLTASEITQLKLDADWVVLSACNTAAGGSDKSGAEALSGLARGWPSVPDCTGPSAAVRGQFFSAS